MKIIPDVPAGTKKILTVSLASVLALSAGIMFFIHMSDSWKIRDAETDGSTRPAAVRVQMPEYRTMEKKVSYTGTVYPGREIRIIAQLQGTVTELPFEEGDFFSENTLLSRLDSPGTAAAVERFEADYQYWKRRYEADKRLSEQNAIAREHAEASGRALRNAAAGLAEARANLDKTVINAPFAGQVLERYVEQGQPMMPGQVIMLIGDNSREIKVNVLEEDLSRGVALNIPVRLKIDNSSVIESRVERISGSADGQTRSFRVTVPVPSDYSGTLRRGASAGADFIISREENTLAVPVTALADRDRSPHVFVISGNTAYKTTVVPGISEKGWISADFPWDRQNPVAVTNLSSLDSGTPVYPVSAEGRE